MKALVLSGGAGTRLRPITHTSAKQLLPVANKPVLFYGLEAIRDAGITDVGMVVGDTAAAIEEAVGDGSAFGLNVTYIRQEAPLGLAHAVLIAREFLGDDDFVMYLGDNFIVGGIAPLVDEFRVTRPDAQIMLTRVPDPREFGVAELDESGQVIGLEEKPQQPKSDLALVGVYMFTPSVHEAVSNLKPSGRGELEITEAIQWLIDSGRKVASTTISGYWKDTGNVADMLEVNRLVLETAEPAQRGAVDPAMRADRPGGDRGRRRGQRVPHRRPGHHRRADPGSGSYLGPFTSVAPRTAPSPTARSNTRSCCAGASVSGVRRIEASIIGRDVEVTPAPRVPKAHRLILGDHSKVQISSWERDPGDRRGRVHRLALRPHPARRRLPRLRARRGDGAGQAHLRGQPGQPGAGRRRTRGCVSSRATSATPRCSRRCCPGHDVVINFAAETHVDRSIAGAAEFVAANVAGVQVLLQACLDAGVGPVVQVSTDEVYGSIPAGSWTEDAPLAPNSPYSAAKAGGDLIARAYARTHGLNVRITRCCNNYGPYQFPEKVIPLFVTNLLDGLTVPLYGDGGNVRDWIHVDDHCRGIQLVLERGRAGEITTSAATRS